jgi:hypothetical protein
MSIIKRLSFLVLLPGLVLVPAAHATPEHARANQRIALPAGFHPVGITTDGKRFLYVGSLDDGAIWRRNVRTGAERLLVEGRNPRAATGITFDRRCSRIVVAGGDTHRVRLHDARTGERVRTYGFGARQRFLSDVVVTRSGMFATDSINPELAVVRFLPGRQFRCDPPPRSSRTLKLTGDLVMKPGTNLSGIVQVGRSLVSVQSNTGRLFRINPTTGATHRIAVKGGKLRGGAGMEPLGHRRFAVVRTSKNRITTVHLNRSLTLARVVQGTTASSFRQPTTAARLRGNLYVVNSRSSTPPKPDTAYWLTRMRIR